MELTPIFSVGLGKADATPLLNAARQLFADNQEVITDGQNGLRTTLQRYNSLQDCAVLNNQAALNEIKAGIKARAIKFYAGLGFDTDDLDFEVVNVWLNEMRAQSTHPPHNHYGFQISGCFYVDVPTNSGVIQFFTNERGLERGDAQVKNYTPYTAKTLGISVDEGDMYFWESLLTHHVPALDFEGVRRSIAYDVSVAPKIQTPQPQGTCGMTLDQYVAIYNINDPELCKQIIAKQDESAWIKHGYHDAYTGENISYPDDLDMSYQDVQVTNKLQKFFETCVVDYIKNVAPIQFVCKALTPIRCNRYKIGTNMKPHVDHIHTIFDGERKGVPILSVVALLNDDFEGGDFLMFGGKKVKLVAGDVIVFPSNFLYPHAVTSITKGVRYSCVSWGY